MKSHYNVGWHVPFGAELAQYLQSGGEEIDGIDVFFKPPFSLTLDTPELAQKALENIIAHNNKSKLELLCGGADRLFIVEFVPTGLDQPKYKYQKWEPAAE
jgi:hypothetical protein